LHFYDILDPKGKSDEISPPAEVVGGATAAFSLPFGPAIQLPPEFEGRKGRYWNYEKNKWSFCSDSETEEPEIEKSSSQLEPINSVVVIKTQQVDPRDGWICPCCTLLNIPTR